MAIRSVGINQPWSCPTGLFGFAGDLESLKGCGADFVELMPAELGVILGGDLELALLRIVQELLLEADLAYTVHAPLEVNLMDLSAYEAQRRVLEASIRFAGRVGARVVVCHAGQRIGPRDARHSLRQQLAVERLALRQAGDIAGELGVTIAVENYYPELPVVRGAVYDYSVWPSELAEQISAVDHLAVGICLDVGHAALASGVFGFDSPFGDLHPALLVELHQPPLAGCPGEAGDLLTRIVLGTLQHPHPLVVEDEEGYVVHSVTARYRTTDEVGHDVAAACLRHVATLVR